eukprot:2213697-Amphidinium_carterae.1
MTEQSVAFVLKSIVCLLCVVGAVAAFAAVAAVAAVVAVVAVVVVAVVGMLLLCTSNLRRCVEPVGPTHVEVNA